MKNGIFSVMSYNVWCFHVEEERVNRLMKLIESKSPDTFGVQEATPAWMQYLAGRFEPPYAHLGQGRDGGDKGEHMCVFYDTARFNFIDGGTRWFTSTPEVSSFCEGAYFPRNMVYAILEEKATGKRYMHINSHIEPIDGHVTRLLDFAAQYDLPVIMTGDFNIEEGTELYEKIVTTPLFGGRTFRDAKFEADKTEDKFTWHGYGKADPQKIDFCFVAGKIDVKKYSVCDEKIDGEYPSDHHPLYVEFQIK